MKREKIKVEKRKLFGKKLKKLRREGILPANIYGKGFKSTAVQLPLTSFQEVFSKVHETGLVDLELGKEQLPVLIHNVQINPKTQNVIHADFFKVNLKEKVTANIPLVSVGEAKAVSEKKGILLHLLSEVGVEALPTDLPEKIEVNVEHLSEVDDQVIASDIKLPSGVTLLTDPSQILFRIGEFVTKEAEAEAVAEEAAAAEAEAAQAEAEGEKEAPETDEKAGEQKEEEKPTEEKKEAPEANQEEKKE